MNLTLTHTPTCTLAANPNLDDADGGVSRQFNSITGELIGLECRRCGALVGADTDPALPKTTARLAETIIGWHVDPTEEGGKGTIHPMRLGRHVEHDPRSRDYPVSETLRPLKSVLWTRRAPVFDQGSLGSCTGNAMAGWLATDGDGLPGLPAMTERNALTLYEAATRLDHFPGEYPPEDTGSTGLAVAKAAKRAGLIGKYHHAFGLYAALTALQTGPVITGVNWTEGFDRPDSNGLVELGGQARGGHEFLVLGIDVDKRTVRACNSWGDAWGDKGYFEFTWTDWDALLHQQGDVTVPIR